MERKRKLWMVAGIFLAIFLSVPVLASQETQNPDLPVATPTPEAPQVTPSPTPVPVKNGLKKEGGKYYYYVKGKKVKSKWINNKADGKRYYFSSKGYAVTYSAKIDKKLYVFNTKGQLIRPKKSSIVKVGKNSYYVNTKGIASTGWLKISNNLYYADSKGRFYKNKKYQGVIFTSSGAAKKNDAAQLKLKTMTLVPQITKGCKTKSQKLQKCWNYVVGNVRYFSYYPNINKLGWQKSTALYTLGNLRGNCYGYACAFAALASEVGYDPYVICGRVSGNRDGAPDGLTRHCWVKIDGRYYDPEAHAKGWMRNVYGSYGYNITHTIQKTLNFKNSNP